VRLYEITPHLYVSGHPSARDTASLSKASISAIITLSRKPLPIELHGWGNVTAHMPIPDGLTLDCDKIERIVSLTEALIDDGETVLVHCLAGRNRSCLIAACVLQDGLRLRGIEAVQALQRARPNSLYNPVFVRYIAERSPKCS
jgi:protein-tyrosine phosphatase